MTTETMRAIVLDGYGGPDQLQLRTVPRPAMMPHNEVMIEVHAAGINPFEAKLRKGWLQGLFPLPPAHILGNDVAGIVVAVGFDVSELEVGDRVYALLDPMRAGSYADYVVAPSYAVRRMPSNLSFAEAAAVPMAACTAWYGLVDVGGIKLGDRVFVQAGGGGVGSFAVQIAKHFGAYVIASASAEKTDYVRSLGADEVIDYKSGDFSTQVRDIDVAIDTIGGEALLRCYPALRRGGTLVVVLRGDPVEIENRERLMSEHGVTTKVVAFSARPDILDQMRPLFEGGALRPPRIEILALDQAAEAHRRIDGGRTAGKIVLQVRP